MSDAMECHTSIPRTVGLALLGVAITALSFWVARRTSGLEMAIGWFGVLFFGAACLFSLVQLFRRAPSISIDSQGISAVRLGKEKVSWSMVEAVSIGEMQSQKFLCIWLRDEPGYMSVQSMPRQLLAKANAKLGFPALTLSFQGLTPGLSQAYEYIKRYVPEKSSN